jgi:hypothetical protein
MTVLLMVNSTKETELEIAIAALFRLTHLKSMSNHLYKWARTRSCRGAYFEILKPKFAMTAPLWHLCERTVHELPWI